VEGAHVTQPETRPEDTAGDVLRRVIQANAADEILLTDRGNGRRFAELYRDVVRYVVDRDEWLVRSGPHWAPDPSRLTVFALTAGVIRQIREEALRPVGAENEDAWRERMLGYATQLEAEGARLRMISCAREHPELVVEEDDLDSELNHLATPDGVVDLLTGEFRGASAEDTCTRTTTVGYDPAARSPLLDQYLETFVPDEEDQEVLFGVLGTILRGGNPGRLLPFFLGGTTSGKSQLLAALDRLLGAYICTINVSVFRGNLDDKPRPDLVRAMHHRIAYAVEASKTWELHSDQVKRITGGDAVPHRDLYGKSVEKVPRFTPLIVTNEMPRIKGADQALKRRLLVVRFDKTLPPELEDSRVKERFVRDEGCLRALLARIVAGARCEALRDGVKWTLLPTRYAEAKLASFERLDHVSEFIEWLRDREALESVNMAETAVSHCAKANELHEWYGTWLKKHGDKQDKAEALNLRDFGQALRDRGWVSKTSAGVRWVGVRLTSVPGLWG
jgi:P4 family phage/plasmid primase-like protien